MRNCVEQKLDQLPLGVYDGRELVSRKGLIDGFLDDKFECLFLGVWIGSVNVIKLGSNEGIGLGKELGDLDGILPGKYDEIKVGSPEYYPDENIDSKFEGLLLGDWLVSVVLLDLGNNEGT